MDHAIYHRMHTKLLEDTTCLEILSFKTELLSLLSRAKANYLINVYKFEFILPRFQVL